MMFPCRGFVRGTQTTTDISGSSAWSWRAFSMSSRPPIVSLAMTSARLMGSPPRGNAQRSRSGDRAAIVRSCVLLHAGRLLEHPVHRAGHAVLVRAADDGRDRVEVEHRRRRG